MYTPNHQIPIVSSTRGCMKAIQEILQYPIVALDCEGVNLSKDGKLCLIQIATPKKVYLFDVLKAGDKLFFDKGLRLILENKKILKVVHDCRRDSEALYFQYGIYMRGVWDTQVAYAILSQLKGNKSPYPIGLNTLFRVCGVEGNQFKSSVKNAMSAMKNFWEVRPLSRMMVDYAAGDVKTLLNVYSMITADLTLHAQGYDFKKIIEEYSHKYVLMNICEDSGIEDGADRSASYNLYGISTWDEDIGLGTSTSVFEEYKRFEKGAAIDALTTTQGKSLEEQEEEDQIAADVAEILYNAQRERAERQQSYANKPHYIVESSSPPSYQYSKHQQQPYYNYNYTYNNNTPNYNNPPTVAVDPTESTYYGRRRYY